MIRISENPYEPFAKNRRQKAHDARHREEHRARIESYRNGQHDGAFTWSEIKAFAGYSRVALWGQLAIREAFRTGKEATRADATREI